MNFDLTTLEDGQIKVCLTEDQVTACCYVSSMHLVDEKEKQLRAAIKRQVERREEEEIAIA